MNDENIHIGKLLKVFVKYWKIYLPIGLLCLLAGIAFIWITPKEYGITASMQLIDDKQGMMSELKMLKSTGLSALLGDKGSGVNSEDEILLITSRNNLTKVIRDTEFQVATKVRKGLKKQLLDPEESPVNYTFPAFFLDTISAPVDIKMNIENNQIKSIQVESVLFDDITFKNQSFPFQMILPVGTLSITRHSAGNGTFTTKILPLQKTYEELIKEISVTPSETMSNIILLEYDAENKKRGTHFLNAMMSTYNEYSRYTKKSEAEINALFIKNRLDNVTSELALLEHRIELYKQSNKMPNPELYGSMTYMGNKETERLILDAETRLRMVDYVIGYINKPVNTYSAIPFMDGIGDGTIAAYNQIIFARQRLAQSSEGENPALQLIDNQLKEQRKILVESVDNIRKNIQIGLEALYKKDAKLSNEVENLPTQEREYIEMMRQQKTQEGIYLFLLQKLQEKELANSPSELAGRIVDEAYCSYKPVFPKSSVVLAIAFIVACVLSLIIISLRVYVFCKKVR